MRRRAAGDPRLPRSATSPRPPPAATRAASPGCLGVRYWQGWNEPNLSEYLTPSGDAAGPAGARQPRLVSEAAERLLRRHQGGRRGDVVVTAGTAPFGDHRRGARRMDPAYFVRNLFCLRGRRRPRPIRRCGPVRFDALAHHPYPIGPPTRTTAAPDDVVPDIWKLTRPLRVALKRQGPSPPAQADLGHRDLLGHRTASTRTVSRSAARPATWRRLLHALAPGRRRGRLVLMRDDPAGAAMASRSSRVSTSAARRLRRTGPSRSRSRRSASPSPPTAGAAWHSSGVSHHTPGPSRSSCGAAGAGGAPSASGHATDGCSSRRAGSEGQRAASAAGQRDEPPLARLRERPNAGADTPLTSQPRRCRPAWSASRRGRRGRST